MWTIALVSMVPCSVSFGALARAGIPVRAHCAVVLRLADLEDRIDVLEVLGRQQAQRAENSGAIDVTTGDYVIVGEGVEPEDVGSFVLEIERCSAAAVDCR